MVSIQLFVPGLELAAQNARAETFKKHKILKNQQQNIAMLMRYHPTEGAELSEKGASVCHTCWELYR
jgi:hypothetical protein